MRHCCLFHRAMMLRVFAFTHFEAGDTSLSVSLRIALTFRVVVDVC